MKSALEEEIFGKICKSASDMALSEVRSLCRTEAQKMVKEVWESRKEDLLMVMKQYIYKALEEKLDNYVNDLFLGEF